MTDQGNLSPGTTSPAPQAQPQGTFEQRRADQRNGGHVLKVSVPAVFH